MDRIHVFLSYLPPLPSEVDKGQALAFTRCLCRRETYIHLGRAFTILFETSQPLPKQVISILQLGKPA